MTNNSIEERFIHLILAKQTIEQIRRLAAKHHGHDEEDCLGCHAIKWLTDLERYEAGDLSVLPAWMREQWEQRTRVDYSLTATIQNGEEEED